VSQASRRQRRVADLLRIEISQIIQNHIRDPRVGFITVTEVDLSPDLRNAKVFVQIMGDEKDRKDSLIGLQRAASYIRSDVASRVLLRYMPQLRFIYDERLDKAERINQLLKEANNENE
jgi:ribosome-binding factor A